MPGLIDALSLVSHDIHASTKLEKEDRAAESDYPIVDSALCILCDDDCQQHCSLTATNRVIEGVAGGWGGKCTCPDGQVYQVGDNHDGCGSLACVGGTPGECNKDHGPWHQKKVECVGLPNRVIEGVAGGWGGKCTCPDGQVYQVGDNHDGCGSLACVGGTPGECNKHHGPWHQKKVECAGLPNRVIEGVAGGWGGKCT